MLAGHFLGTPAVLRELLPQDLKLEMDQLTREEAIGAARFLASVVGEAHAQQMEKDERTEWHTCVKLDRSNKLDAPSWLWTSVVELVASLFGTLPAVRVARSKVRLAKFCGFLQTK